MTDSLLKDITLLYVEDEDVIRENLSRFLKRRVKELFLAKNGQEGLEMFTKHSPDLVLTDIRMPKLDGLEMIRHIRTSSNVPVIITTGHNDEEYLLKSIDIGVDKYLKKPIDNHDLEEALNYFAGILMREQQLENRNRFIREILDIYPGLLMITDGNNINYLNRSFLEFMELNPDQPIDSYDIDIDAYLVRKEHAFYRGKIFQEWVAEMIERPELDYLFYIKPINGDDDDITIYLSRIIPIKDSGEYLVSFTDITLMETIKQLFHELAVKDPLTRVYNRKKFYEELEREMDRAKRYDHELSIIMFDIDHFKLVNDEFGHQEGDRILIEIVELVRTVIRKSDVFGRYGGEEFIIFLPETERHKAYQLAGRLRACIGKNNFRLNKNITCSFGVAEYKKEQDIDDLIRNVDNALYRAKQNGRNRVELDNPIND